MDGVQSSQLDTGSPVMSGLSRQTWPEKGFNKKISGDLFNENCLENQIFHSKEGPIFSFGANNSHSPLWATQTKPKLVKNNLNGSRSWAPGKLGFTVQDDKFNIMSCYGGNKRSFGGQPSYHPHTAEVKGMFAPGSEKDADAVLPLLQGNVSVSNSKFKGTIKHKGTRRKSGKSSTDCPDPDFRTIEMLRELERVADQKEVESEDYGNDRKSLVSHHLRMLMCAVDRYTEGMDEDDPIARQDELMLSSPDNQTSALEVSSLEPSASISRMCHQPDNKASSLKNEVLSTKEPQNDVPPQINDVGPQMYELSDISSQKYGFPDIASHFWGHPAPNICPPLPTCHQQGGYGLQETAAWNLWSSPTFDFCDMLQVSRPCYQRCLL